MVDSNLCKHLKVIKCLESQVETLQIFIHVMTFVVYLTTNVIICIKVLVIKNNVMSKRKNLFKFLNTEIFSFTNAQKLHFLLSVNFVKQFPKT